MFHLKLMVLLFVHHPLSVPSKYQVNFSNVLSALLTQKHDRTTTCALLTTSNQLCSICSCVEVYSPNRTRSSRGCLNCQENQDYPPEKTCLPILPRYTMVTPCVRRLLKPRYTKKYQVRPEGAGPPSSTPRSLAEQKSSSNSPCSAVSTSRKPGPYPTCTTSVLRGLAFPNMSTTTCMSSKDLSEMHATLS